MISKIAVILAGGYGTRLSPLTPKYHKSFLPIADKPNVVHTVDMISDYDKIYILTNHISDPYAHQYFDDVANVEIINCDVDSYQNTSVSLRIGLSKIIYKQIRHITSNTQLLVIEGDQHFYDYSGSPLYQEYYKSGFVCSKREHEWLIHTDDEGIIGYETDGNGYCLNGIGVFVGGDIITLYNLLNYNNTDETNYYESVVLDNIRRFNSLITYCHDDEYSVEYDSITDILDKHLIEPDEIAKMISDDGNAERLSSMTNYTYKIKYNDQLVALRLPGAGTSTFIIRSYEERVLSDPMISKYTVPTKFYDNNSVKVTEYLENSRISDSGDFENVIRVLKSLHYDFRISVDLPYISLIREIINYETNYDRFDTHYTYDDEYNTIRDMIIEIDISRYTNEDVTLCHRDLVPHNIMVDNDTGEIKLIDWEYSGMTSKYWDYGSYCSEYAMYNNLEIEEVLDRLLSISPDLDKSKLYQWTAIVDFIWTAWSIAKTAAGEDYIEYGKFRYDRCKRLLRESGLSW